MSTSDAVPGGGGGLEFEGPEFSDEEDEFEDEESDVDDLAGNRASDVEEEGRDLDEYAGNRATGGIARAVLEHVARSIVDEPEMVVIEVSESRGTIRLSLHVAPSDMGRVIGRRGRVAQAIRTLVRAAAAREGTDAVVDIVDD